MSRPLIIEYPGAWYHVMNRGRRSEKIYLDDEDYHSFVELLIESSELWSVNICAFSLMPNHYHLLINTPLGNLSRFMRHVNGVYTQRFNNAHKYEGTLFKGRYKSILIEFDNYFLQLIGYIHRNPIRAKLVNNLEDYKWSSHHAYINKSPKWAWIKSEQLLSILSEKTDDQIGKYIKFMEIDDDPKLIKVIESKKWPSLLGGDKFINLIKRKYFPEVKDKEIPESGNLAPDIELIKEMVCEYFNIPPRTLCRAKRQSYNEPRNMAIYLSRYLRNDSLKRISKEYLLGSESSVSSILNSIREMIINDPEVENKVVEMSRLVTKREIKT